MEQNIYTFLGKWNLSFRLKLVIGFALLIGLIALAIIIIFPSQFEKQAISSLTDKAESINRMTAFSIGSALYFDDVETIEEVISSARQNKDIFYLVVLDQNGKVVTAQEYNSKYFSEFSTLNVQSSISEDGNILNTKIPITINSREIGQLFMGFSLDDVKQRINNSTLTIIIISLIISLLGIFAVYGISRLVTNPLEKMVKTVSQITPENLSVRADIQSQDEIGNLARSFNTMVGNLEKNTLELEQEIDTRKKAEEVIQESLEEKVVLIKEIHHRVKNNLQVISSLLYLQSKNIENEEMLALFTESQNRVKSMALIHEKLYQGSDLANINFSDYIQNLTTYLVDTYEVDGKRIQVKYDVAEEIELDLDTAIPCGLIMNELVTNSLKYAFSGNGSLEPDAELNPEISISLNANASEGYCMKIADNGCGIPEDFDLNKAKSLGLKLVTSLVNQIRGKITVERNEGVAFQIEFE